MLRMQRLRGIFKVWWSQLWLVRVGRRYYGRWLDRRIPRADAIVLNRHNLLVIPTKAGWSYLFTALLLWITGTNYQNNLVLSISFIMLSVMVVCIYHTFLTLAGLRIEFVRVSPCFAGEQGELRVRVSRDKGGNRESIFFETQDKSRTRLDLLDEDSTTVNLLVGGSERGWQQIPRIRMQSVFPLGLIRCWTWLGCQRNILVYPKPVMSYQPPLGGRADSEGDLREVAGSDDFFGLRPYQPGMSIKHIDWKHFARGQGLFSKDYVSPAASSVQLDWERLINLEVEQRLSVLSYWVVQFSSEGRACGLVMPGCDIRPATGDEQRRQLLKALALYGKESLSSRGEGVSGVQPKITTATA